MKQTLENDSRNPLSKCLPHKVLSVIKLHDEKNSNEFLRVGVQRRPMHWVGGDLKYYIIWREKLSRSLNNPHTF